MSPIKPISWPKDQPCAQCGRGRDARRDEEVKTMGCFVCGRPLPCLSSRQQLEAENTRLREALEAIKTALDGASGYTAGGGSYWAARRFVESRGGWTGDLEGVSVLHEVARAALSHPHKEGT